MLDMVAEGVEGSAHLVPILAHPPKRTSGAVAREELGKGVLLLIPYSHSNFELI